MTMGWGYLHISMCHIMSISLTLLDSTWFTKDLPNIKLTWLNLAYSPGLTVDLTLTDLCMTLTLTLTDLFVYWWSEKYLIIRNTLKAQIIFDYIHVRLLDTNGQAVKWSSSQFRVKLLIILQVKEAEYHELNWYSIFYDQTWNVMAFSGHNIVQSLIK